MIVRTRSTIDRNGSYQRETGGLWPLVLQNGFKMTEKYSSGFFKAVLPRISMGLFRRAKLCERFRLLSNSLLIEKGLQFLT